MAKILYGSRKSKGGPLLIWGFAPYGVLPGLSLGVWRTVGGSGGLGSGGGVGWRSVPDASADAVAVDVVGGFVGHDLVEDQLLPLLHRMLPLVDGVVVLGGRRRVHLAKSKPNYLTEIGCCSKFKVKNAVPGAVGSEKLDAVPNSKLRTLFRELLDRKFRKCGNTELG